MIDATGQEQVVCLVVCRRSLLQVEQRFRQPCPGLVLLALTFRHQRGMRQGSSYATGVLSLSGELGAALVGVKGLSELLLRQEQVAKIVQNHCGKASIVERL